MSKAPATEKPVIHVTDRGWYVKVDDLLNSESVKEVIGSMAKVPFHCDSHFSDTPAKKK